MKKLVALFLFFVFVQIPIVWGDQEAPYNVLFIAVDDLNDWIGPLDGGRPKAKTPNLDRLAEMGVTFTNAHCASPACQPSRVAVMTGVAPARSGVLQNLNGKDLRPEWRKRSKVLENVVTLSQHFRDNGYYAAGGGKIYHAGQWTEHSENDPTSWDAYFPDFENTMPSWVRAQHISDAEAGFTPGRPLGDGGIFNYGPLAIPDEETSDYKVVDWLHSELEKKHEKPFFLACGIYRPHIPWEVPQKYFDMYPLDSFELPKYLKNDLEDGFSHGREWWHKWVLENELWRSFVQGYLASITYADTQIGRILDGLLASEYRDNTIVVLWSDHGMHLGEKDNWEKFTLYEEATRVPLFFIVPGMTKGGARCKRAVSLLDLYPTLAELSGFSIPKHCDGQSLVPLLKDVNAVKETPAVTSYRFHYRNDKSVLFGHSVRTDRWRYCQYDDGNCELYDHAKDPDEYTNLAGDPEFVDRIRELSKWIPKSVAELMEKKER